MGLGGPSAGLKTTQVIGSFAAVMVADKELRPVRRGKVPRGLTTIEFELKGGDRVRVEGSADAALLANIVSALRRT
jgi:RNase P/RNase MRP subunit p29